MYFTENNLNSNPKSKNLLVREKDVKWEEDVRRVCKEEDRKWEEDMRRVCGEEGSKRAFIRKNIAVRIRGERREERGERERGEEREERVLSSTL